MSGEITYIKYLSYPIISLPHAHPAARVDFGKDFDDNSRRRLVIRDTIPFRGTTPRCSIEPIRAYPKRKTTGSTHL
jgi:hypothetical protein